VAIACILPPRCILGYTGYRLARRLHSPGAGGELKPLIVHDDLDLLPGGGLKYDAQLGRVVEQTAARVRLPGKERELALDRDRTLPGKHPQVRDRRGREHEIGEIARHEDDRRALYDISGEGWPSGLGPNDDQDIVELVAGHLSDGWVAVLMEAGSEKLRYIHGSAVAVNSEGDLRKVDLSEIYALAEDLGSNVSEAEL